MGAYHCRHGGHLLMALPHDLEQFLADTLGPAEQTQQQDYVFKVQFYNVARELAKTCKPWKPSYEGEQPPF